MSNERARAETLDVRPAIVVSLCVWVLPIFGQWLLGAVGTRKFVYDTSMTIALQLVSLSIVGVVFRRMRARDQSLVHASAVATLAIAPLGIAVFVFDSFVSEYDPGLAWKPPTYDNGPLVFFVAAFTGSIAMAMLTGGIVFLPLFARAHEERSRAVESIHRDAELLRIRSHLEPHFILNSLNAVAGLVDEDPAQAREMIVSLGDLFRQASKFRETHRVSDEVEWLRGYARIHELRHPDRVSFEWDVDPSTTGLAIPALVLQPLVENAIRHGALRGGPVVRVSVRRDGSELVCTVTDHGAALGGPREGGQGLDIVRRRLAVDELDDDAFQLVREGDATVARVRLPIREAER